MAHLNTLKIIGLVILLAIALTLPSVLPKSATEMDAHTTAPADSITADQSAANIQIIPTIKL